MKIKVELLFDGQEDTLKNILNGTLINSIENDFLESDEKVVLVKVEELK